MVRGDRGGRGGGDSEELCFFNLLLKKKKKNCAPHTSSLRSALVFRTI